MKALLCAATVLFAFNSMAAKPSWSGIDKPNWAFAGEFFDSRKKEYVDVNSIQIRGNLRLAWVLVDYYTASDQGNGALSNVSLQEFDCAQGKSRTLMESGYNGRMGTGDVRGVRMTPANSAFNEFTYPLTEKVCSYVPR